MWEEVGYLSPWSYAVSVRRAWEAVPFQLARQMIRVGGGGDPGQEGASLLILFACVLKSLCRPK